MPLKRRALISPALRWKASPEDQAPATVAQPPERAKPNWIALENAQQLSDGAWMPVRVAGKRLVVCRVDGNLYAYRNNCPACNMPFDAGALEAGLLRCPLGHRYDVQHAGRCDGNADRAPGSFPAAFPRGGGESGSDVMKAERAKVTVHGVVQGVGFRPFVYRLATQLKLSGWVLNSGARRLYRGRRCTRDRLQSFLLRLEREKPPRAVIQSLEFSFLDAAGYDRFEIRYSDQSGRKTAFDLTRHCRLRRLSPGDI